MSPWIVRLVLATLVLEVGVCTVFLADAWPPLRHGEEAVFQTVLGATRDQGSFILEESPPVSRLRIVRPLVAGTERPYFQVGVNKESAPELEAFPPSPVDWHLMLKNVQAVGCEVAAIEQPLTWENEDMFRLATLETALALFDTAVLTVDLRRARTDQVIPGYLRRSAIPLANVHGNLDRLVLVNSVIFPPSATGSGNIQFSFRLQESEKDLDPAFVRWGDSLIPSFPLAVAMAQHQIDPAGVQIHIGRHIRLGDGPIVPIDDFGQLRMESIAKPKHSFLNADGIILESQVPEAKRNAGEEVPRCALFTDAREDNPAPWLSPNGLQRLVSTFDVLPLPSTAEPHHRLPLWAEITILALIAGVAALLIRAQSLTRLIAFGVLLAVSLLLLVVIFNISRSWIPLAPILATGLLGWFLCSRMSRYLPPKLQEQAEA